MAQFIQLFTEHTRQAVLDLRNQIIQMRKDLESMYPFAEFNFSVDINGELVMTINPEYD